MKPSSDGEFVKDCLIAVADIVCPDKKQLFSEISLSARTVTRRIEALSSDVKQSLKDLCGKFEFFSIAMDESTDVKDTAQLTIYVRGVTSEFDIVEDLARLHPLKDTTTGKDVFEAVKLCIEDMGLKFDQLVNATTDGAPSMVGKINGVVALIEKHMNEIGIKTQLVKFHCIIHQQAFCAKSATLKEVMQVVVKTVNFILSRGLNHHQFQELLKEVDSEYGELLYFCEVRWLSRGAMLNRVYKLRKKIADFMIAKQKETPEFSDLDFLSSLAFLVDITDHLNKLNKKLQGFNQFVNVLYEHVVTFQCMLRLWNTQLDQGNLAHFPTLQEQQPADVSIYAAFIDDLQVQFNDRFQDMRCQRENFKLFASPFEVEVEAVLEELQMELIELQGSSALKIKYRENDILQFYKHYLMDDGSYPGLVQHAKKICCMFGSTYLCESLFSKMKYTKSRLRS